MKHIILITFLTILLPRLSMSQTWSYSSGEEPFDGKYRTASIIGSSINTTYKNPMLTVNNFENSNEYNVYLANVGYFCDGLKAMFRFDDDPTIIKCKPGASNKQSVAFLNSFFYFDEFDEMIYISKFEFLSKIEQYSKMYIRLSDDCDQVNMEFSLSGSSKALNYVYGDRAEEIKMLRNIKEWRSKLKEGDQVFLKLSKGGKYITVNEKPTYKSDLVYKMTFSDTVVFNSIDNNMIEVIIKDSIQGWVNSLFAYPIE